MKKFVLGMTILGAALAPALAFAQEETEIGKLKERMMALEQKIYSNSGSTTVSPSSNNRMMADFEARLYNLEEESQKVYGAVEELGHSVDEFAKKMDLIAKDFDLRLTDLETAVDTFKKNGVAPVVPNTESKSESKKDTSKATTSVKSADVSDIPADISAEDMYSKAYHFLVATKYDDAEKWMKEFIKRHPSDELADNAHYWLGEIYLVKEMPEQAVISFSTGFSKFPTGAKAPSNLLKMGSAFKQMGKVDHAKSSWRKLEVDFPDSPEADKAKKELEKLASE